MHVGALARVDLDGAEVELLGEIGQIAGTRQYVLGARRKIQRRPINELQLDLDTKRQLPARAEGDQVLATRNRPQRQVLEDRFEGCSAPRLDHAW